MGSDPHDTRSKGRPSRGSKHKEGHVARQRSAFASLQSCDDARVGYNRLLWWDSILYIYHIYIIYHICFSIMSYIMSYFYCFCVNVESDAGKARRRSPPASAISSWDLSCIFAHLGAECPCGTDTIYRLVKSFFARTYLRLRKSARQANCTTWWETEG